MQNSNSKDGTNVPTSTNIDCTSSSQTIANPNVVCSVDELFNREKEAAKNDFNLACDLYRQFVGGAETREERLRLIQKFRCG